jgi:hypothetical protein
MTTITIAKMSSTATTPPAAGPIGELVPPVLPFPVNIDKYFYLLL